MPKKKSEPPEKDAAKKDRHKPSYQVRIPTVFVPKLEKLAEINGNDVSDEVRTAVREYLRRNNLWPKALVETDDPD